MMEGWEDVLVGMGPVSEKGNSRGGMVIPPPQEPQFFPPKK